MKVLVLGSQGQLGKCINDQLSSEYFEVIYTSRKQIDIGNLLETKKQIIALNPDVVINAAGFTAVDKAEQKQEHAMLINSTAVANIAEVCQKVDCFLIHISTDYVFDGLSLAAYKEDDHANPIGVYGKTKLQGEIAVCSSGCKYIIIRTAWVFSEYGNNFLKTMLNLALNQNELRVVNDQFGCPTYAQDIAKAIVKIIKNIKSKKTASCLYHFSGNICISWAKFSDVIIQEAIKFNILKNKPKIIGITSDLFPSTAKRPPRTEINSKKIKQTFGIESPDYVIGIRSSLNAIIKKKIKI